MFTHHSEVSVGLWLTSLRHHTIYSLTVRSIHFKHMWFFLTIFSKNLNFYTHFRKNIGLKGCSGFSKQVIQFSNLQNQDFCLLLFNRKTICPGDVMCRPLQVWSVLCLLKSRAPVCPSHDQDRKTRQVPINLFLM